MPRSGDHEEPLRDLLLRLIEAARAYVRAELELWRRIALAKLGAAGLGIALAVAALFLIQAALTVLVAALGLLLSRWLGTAGGLAGGALLTVVIAALLGRIAIAKLAALGKDR